MTRLVRWTAAAACLAAARLPAQRVSFVQVDDGVKLEVLDWGGTGRPVVLLAGNTRTAHDFADFAPTLAATYHVYGITRRGFGASSVPSAGYDTDRLGDDVLAVIDSLGLAAPVLAGHSRAGAEMSSIGARHPEKVAGLIYLDAGYGYAFYSSGDVQVDANEIRQGVERLRLVASRGDVESIRRTIARLLETDLPALERSLRSVEQATPARSTVPPTPLMPPLGAGVGRLMEEGLRRYTSVRAPVLAIYAGQSKGMPTTLGSDSAAIAWLEQRVPAVRTLRRTVPGARVVILPRAAHDVFRSDEADVLREMYAFTDALPARSTPR